MMRRSLLLATLSLVLGCAVLAGGAQAATSPTSQDITITPSSTQLTIEPGGTKSGSLSVINSGDNNSFDFILSTAPYYVKGVDYTPDFTLLPGKVDASKWIHISSPLRQTVAARKIANIDYTVTVPKNTEPGGYYAVVFAETQPPANAGVVSHNRVGDILYITVSGPVKTSGSVAASPLPLVTLSGSVPVGLTVSNTGGVHFVSTADVSVVNIFGKTVFHAKLERFVLPQTVRKISATWEHTPPIGLYRIERSATAPGKSSQLPDRWMIVVQPWVLVVLVVLIVAVGFRWWQSKRKHSNRLS